MCINTPEGRLSLSTNGVIHSSASAAIEVSIPRRVGYLFLLWECSRDGWFHYSINTPEGRLSLSTLQVMPTLTRATGQRVSIPRRVGYLFLPMPEPTSIETPKVYQYPGGSVVSFYVPTNDYINILVDVSIPRRVCYLFLLRLPRNLDTVQLIVSIPRRVGYLFLPSKVWKRSNFLHSRINTPEGRLSLSTGLLYTPKKPWWVGINTPEGRLSLSTKVFHAY